MTPSASTALNGRMDALGPLARGHADLVELLDLLLATVASLDPASDD